MKWLRLWPWRCRPAPPTTDTTGQARQVRAALDAQRAEVERLVANPDDYREAVEAVLKGREG